MNNNYMFSKEIHVCSGKVKLIRDCRFSNTALVDKDHEQDRSCITYLTGNEYIESLLNGEFAGVICTPELSESVQDSFDGGIIISEQPRTSFFEIHNAIYCNKELPDTYIDETAVVAEDARIAAKGVIIGAGTEIKSGAVIAENVTIGKDCAIMENCIVGAPAFYYYGEGDNSGRVISGQGVYIGNRVSLHGLSVIQAGVFNPSFIDDNVIISNGVHVSHDVQIGKNCQLPAGVLLAGLCVLEDNCSLGVGVTVAPTVRVGHDAKLSAGAVVTKSVPPGERYSGNFAIEHSAYVAHIKNISGKNR